MGRIAALGIGSGFVLLQSLSYTGYVNVDWRKVERDTIRAATAPEATQHAADLLAFNMPAAIFVLTLSNRELRI